MVCDDDGKKTPSILCMVLCCPDHLNLILATLHVFWAYQGTIVVRPTKPGHVTFLTRLVLEDPACEQKLPEAMNITNMKIPRCMLQDRYVKSSQVINSTVPSPQLSSVR